MLGFRKRPPKSGPQDEANGDEAPGVVVERTAVDVRGRAGADVRAPIAELADTIPAGCSNLGATGLARGRKIWASRARWFGANSVGIFGAAVAGHSAVSAAGHRGAALCPGDAVLAVPAISGVVAGGGAFLSDFLGLSARTAVPSIFLSPL